MKRLCMFASLILLAAALFAQEGPSVPALPFESAPNPLKYSPDQNFGEVLSVAVNSRGHIIVLNHPGTASSGPVYGNATTQIIRIRCRRQIRSRNRQGACTGWLTRTRCASTSTTTSGWWTKAAMSVIKFNPAGYVLMNLGRRDEGPDQPRYRRADPPPTPVDGYFNGSTDVAWDKDDNIYVSDGYFNSRIAKFDKHGNWIKQWGGPGTGGVHANENPGQIRNPHNIGIDRRRLNVYIADRGLTAVFKSLTWMVISKKFIFLNAPYDKTRHPVLGDLPVNRPDETAPWTICITNSTPQYLYTTDAEPGRLYKIQLPEGKILGKWGESGHELGQLNWAHGLACPSQDLIYIADMNNWRVQKLVTKGKK